MNINITFDNYRIVAAKSYYRVNYSQSEFDSDLRSIMTIRRALTRYKNKKPLNVRQMLNRIIMLCNVFEPETTVRLLFLLLPKDYYRYIIPFLRYLNILPKVVYGIEENDIATDDIPYDDSIYKELLEI